MCRRLALAAAESERIPPLTLRERHPAQSRPVRILIVKTSSMGDVVHALPMAADIARARPEAVVDWLVEQSFAPLPSMSRHVAAVHQVALRRWRRSLLSRATRAEIASVKRNVRRAAYDLVIDAQGLLKSAWVARWARAPIAGLASDSARERVASTFYSRRVSVPREMHAVERCRALAAAALDYTASDSPRFDLTCHAKPAITVNGPYAVLLTNASRATKRWPAQRWVDVERELAERGMISLLFWGSDSEERPTRELAAAMRRAVVAPRSPLDAVAASLSGARMVIGVDTGLTHLAAALGRPTVGIYCDYDPALVGLVGGGSHISLGGAGVQTSAQQVLEAIVQVEAGDT